MKKLLLLGLLIFVDQKLFSQEGIAFEQGSKFQELIQKAKAKDKYIFIDCYTTWCVPCKEMSKEIFTSSKVGKLFNDKFICAQIQFDSTKNDDETTRKRYKDAKALLTEYQIHVFPTFLFFNSDGKIVHKAIGLKSEDAFITIGKDALDQEKQYYTLLKHYQSGKRDKSLSYRLANLSKEIGDDSMAYLFAKAYLGSLKENEIFTRDNIDFIREFTTSSKDRGFKIFYNNRRKISELMKKEDYVDISLVNIIMKESPGVRALSEGKSSSPNWKSIYSEVRNKYDDYYAKRVIAFLKVSYYRQNQAWKEYTASLLPYIQLFGNTIHPVFINNFAWDIFIHSDKRNELLAALSWSNRILQTEKDDPVYIDTYANLLYKLGRRGEAIEWENKAIQLDPRNKDFQEVLQKMINNNGNN